MRGIAQRARERERVGRIDIILPFYNQPELLFMCLSSLEPSVHPETRLILVDDASDAEVHARIEQRCGALQLSFELVRHAENRGFIGAVHSGLDVADAPHVILLNSDTMVTPRFDQRLVAVMEEEPGIKAVAPVSNAPTDLYQYREALDFGVASGTALYAAVARAAARAATGHYGQVTRAPYLTGACLALERAAFEEAGRFSNAYTHGYFEDLDLSCRLRERGYELAVREDCFVYHRGQGTYRHTDRAEQSRRMGANFEKFRERWSQVPEHGELMQRLERATVRG